MEQVGHSLKLGIRVDRGLWGEQDVGGERTQIAANAKNREF